MHGLEVQIYYIAKLVYGLNGKILFCIPVRSIIISRVIKRLRNENKAGKMANNCCVGAFKSDFYYLFDKLSDNELDQAGVSDILKI